MKNRLVPLLLGAVFALGACSAAPSEGPSGTLPELKVGSEIELPTARVSLDKVEISAYPLASEGGSSIAAEEYVLFFTLTNTTDDSRFFAKEDCSSDWLWFRSEDTTGQKNVPDGPRNAVACIVTAVAPGESVEVQQRFGEPAAGESFAYLIVPDDDGDRGRAMGRFAFSQSEAAMRDVELGEWLNTPYGLISLAAATPHADSYELQGGLWNTTEETLAGLCNGDPVWYSATDDTGRPMSEKKSGQEKCAEISAAQYGDWESVISGVGPDTDALYLMTADPSGEKMRTLGKVRLTQ